MVKEKVTQPPGRFFPDDPGLLLPRARLLRREDRMFVRHAGSLASVVLGIRGRVMLPDGSVRPFQEQFTPSTDRSFSTEVFDPGEGWLLALAVFVVSGSPIRGNCFVQVGLLQGVGTAADMTEVLTSDYVEPMYGPHWPDGPRRSSVEGKGLVRTIAGTDPAANTELGETVPTNARWKWLTGMCTFATDANPAGRNVKIVLDDGANEIYGLQAETNQAASSSWKYIFAELGMRSAAGIAWKQLHVPPDVRLMAGFRFRTETGNIQVGDDFSDWYYQVEEWIEE